MMSGKSTFYCLIATWYQYQKEMGMFKMKLVLLVVLLSMFWTVGAWAQLKDGLWEISTQVEMKGMPQQMPPTVARQCMSKNDPAPKSQDKSYDCKTKNSKISGDTVMYEVECKGKGSTILTSGKMIYKSNNMEGTATTIIKTAGQQEMQMVSKMKGAYIGACPK
jgi:hypothetical protein